MAGLHPVLRTISRNLPRVARSLGFQARITSGYRSPKKQAALYQRYLQGLMPYPVAPPGTSDHEKGLAIDVVSTDTPKLVDLLTSVGLFWAGEGDPVHFSLVSHQGENIQGSGQSAFKAWKSGPGSSVPEWATAVPGVGGAFSFLSDPLAYLKEQGETLLTVLLGPL